MNPFTIIGMVTSAVMLVVSVIILLIALYAAWYRGLGKISDFFYDENSVTKMRISGIILVIREFRFGNIKLVWDEAERMVNDDG